VANDNYIKQVVKEWIDASDAYKREPKRARSNVHPNDVPVARRFFAARDALANCPCHDNKSDLAKAVCNWQDAHYAAAKNSELLLKNWSEEISIECSDRMNILANREKELHEAMGEKVLL
jgi:hypothetical protein